MRLFTTDDSFQIAGLFYPDIPFLLDDEMRLADPVNAFLIHQAVHRGATESKKTWLTYGWHLYDYFSFLEANHFQWNQRIEQGTPTIVALYRNWSAKRNNARTVNQRLGTIVRFYRYAHGLGWINVLPWDMEDRVVHGRSGYMGHTSSSNVKQTPDVKQKEKPEVIEVLNRKQISQLLRFLSKNKTHYLMVKLALSTGLRKEELMTFPNKYIFNPDSRSGAELSIKVKLFPSDMILKGNKSRAIFMPKILMRELWDYSVMIRAKYANHNDLIENKNTESLFLTIHGKQYSESAFQKVLSRAGENIGFHIHPHMLRHSYATHELHAMREAKGKTDTALIWVKERLGHTSIKTTEIYLHLLAELEHEYLAAYQYDLDSLIESKEIT